MPTPKWMVLALLIASLPACRPAPPAASGPIVPTIHGMTPPNADQGARQPAVPVPGQATPTQAEVGALLDSWLVAQNQGKFDDYQQFYAVRMTGVRRTGTIVRHFDRPRWLADRKLMFAKAMQVSANQLQSMLNAQITQVDFVQRFATGTFADEGHKRLLLVREAGKLRIAREEMLESKVVPASDAGSAPKTTELALAYTTGAGTWLVVGPAEAATPTAPPQLLEQGGLSAAWQELALPRNSDWFERDVVLYSPQGETCRGRVDQGGLLVRIHPHFGQIERWRGGESGKPLPAGEIAREVWDQGAMAAVRAVHIAPSRGQCQGALWGRASNLPPPTLLARAAMNQGQLRESALEGLRALPAYHLINKDYLAAVAAPRPLHWDMLGGAQPEVTAFSGQGGQWLAVRARAGDLCGGFYAAMIGLFTAHGKGDGSFAVQLLTPERAGDLHWPEAAADIDGDGVFEWIGPTQIWRQIGPTVRPVFTLDIPDFDCPC